jgi:hypothetical protein
MQSKRFVGLTLILSLVSPFSWAATYYELAGRYAATNGQKQYTVPTSMGPGISIQPYPTPAPMLYNGFPPPQQIYYAQPPHYPLPANSAMPMLPAGANGTPNPRQMRWSYGQINAASDPFNAWGLSTQGMYVPWSTPTSSWTNAQGWDWWRNRAGDGGSVSPLW